jgi:predicted DNA-binding transcriptional regulator AlpA
MSASVPQDADMRTEKEENRVMSRPSRKLADDLSYPPRAMRAPRAAAYLDISEQALYRLVDAGDLPQPTRKNGIVSWDRLELDAAYESWKDGTSRNTMHALLTRP